MSVTKVPVHKLTLGGNIEVSELIRSAWNLLRAQDPPCRNTIPSVPGSAANVSAAASLSSTIVTVTKVGADLWTGLEKNDFSKWPSGIFARAFVRDYARAIGLDADEVVDEFCRLFPDIGDRRVARIIKAQAELIGHDPEKVDEASLLPPQGDRRSAGRERKAEVRARRIRLAPRTVSATIDIACTLSLAAAASALVGTNFWSSTGIAGLVYFTISTIFSGASPGSHAVAFLRHRMPALFAVQDRRAHA